MDIRSGPSNSSDRRQHQPLKSASRKRSGPRGGWGLLAVSLLAATAFALSSPADARAEAVRAAQKAPEQAAPPTAGNNRRIIILGTTIVGAIAKPRVIYEVPWKEPDSLRKDLDDPQRSFQAEIFIFLDKDDFEAEIK